VDLVEVGLVGSGLCNWNLVELLQEIRHGGGKWKLAEFSKPGFQGLKNYFGYRKEEMKAAPIPLLSKLLNAPRLPIVFVRRILFPTPFLIIYSLRYPVPGTQFHGSRRLM
jgi:hypothetical protein